MKTPKARISRTARGVRLGQTAMSRAKSMRINDAYYQNLSGILTINNIGLEYLAHSIKKGTPLFRGRRFASI